MTTIKTNCPACGEIDLVPEDIELHTDPTAGSDSFYAFGCPECLLVVRKHADERVIRLLVSAGVTCVALPTATDDPPFTYDDLLDLHALLATEGWFEELLELVRR